MVVLTAPQDLYSTPAVIPPPQFLDSSQDLSAVLVSGHFSISRPPAMFL